MDGHSARRLAGRSVLVVEDDYLIADEMRRDIEGEGGRVLGPAPDVARALRLLEGARPDAAILDVHLGDEAVYPLAEALRARAVPFAFATGYDAWAIDEAFAAVPRFEKPIDVAACLRSLIA